MEIILNGYSVTLAGRLHLTYIITRLDMQFTVGQFYT